MKPHVFWNKMNSFFFLFSNPTHSLYVRRCCKTNANETFAYSNGTNSYNDFLFFSSSSSSSFSSSSYVIERNSNERTTIEVKLLRLQLIFYSINVQRVVYWYCVAYRTNNRKKKPREKARRRNRQTTREQKKRREEKNRRGINSMRVVTLK